MRYLNEVKIKLILANIPTQAKSLLHSLEQEALASKWMQIEYMCFKQKGTISILNGRTKISRQIHIPQQQYLIYWKWFQHPPSEGNHCYQLVIDHMVEWSDKMKWDFFQAMAVSILLYGCTARTQTKHLKKKQDENYARILHIILNKSRKQHPK